MRSRHEQLLSRLPEDWIVCSLNKISARIESGGTPSRDVPAYWNGSIPWVTPGELTGHSDKYLHSTRDRITSQGCAASAARVVPVDSLIVTTRATLGSTALAGVPLSTNQGFKSVVFRDDCDPHFFFHLFKILKPEIVRRASGTTFLEISRRQFGQIEVPLPSLREQRWIAEILDTVDDSIRSTERLVAKLEQLRRSYLLQAIHSVTGRSAVQLGKFLSRIDAGWSPACDETPPNAGEWGILKVSAITGGTFKASAAKRLPSQLKPRPELEVKPGDILLARANGVAELVGVTVEAIGHCSQLMLSDKTLRIVPDQKMLTKSFLVLLLGSPGVRHQVMNLVSGSSGQKNISQAQIKGLNVAIPSIEEQIRITAANACAIQAVTAEQQRLIKLRELKQGLMEDLLTGRVRLKGA